MARRTPINSGKKLSEERAWRVLAQAMDVLEQPVTLTDGVRALFASDLITARMMSRMMTRKMSLMDKDKTVPPAQAVLAALCLEQSTQSRL